MLADSIANLKLLSYLLNKMRYCLTKEKEEEGSFFFLIKGMIIFYSHDFQINSRKYNFIFFYNIDRWKTFS